MPRFYIEFDGADTDEEGVDCPSVDDARNAAIVKLGTYLQEHPEFAYVQHWRVDLKDSSHRLLLHVIVGTIVAPPPKNIASFDPYVQERWFGK